MKKKYFIVYENKKGERSVVSSTDSTKDLVFSSLKGAAVCAAYECNKIETQYAEYFTKDKDSIKGSLTISYIITDKIEYSKQRYVEKIIDVIERSILDKYFHEISIDKNKEIHEVSLVDIKNIIALSNYYIEQIIPFVKITNVSNITIDKTNRIPHVFRFKAHDKMNQEENKESLEIEYYEPLTKLVSDDINSSKMEYPKKVYVPKDSLLVYRGYYREPGTYRNHKAMGTIVSSGKHVTSLHGMLYRAGNIDDEYNKYMVYPNVIYDVNNIHRYIEYYDDIYDLFCKLVKKVVRTCYAGKDDIENIISIEDLKNSYVTDVVNDLNRYGVNVEYISYTTKNPCVRSKQRIRKESDIFGNLFKKNN